VKFEEFVQTIYDFDHWVEEERTCMWASEPRQLGVTPLGKLIAIKILYLKELEDEVKLLEDGYNQYKRWMIISAQKK
jgi:hypothetical protein